MFSVRGELLCWSQNKALALLKQVGDAVKVGSRFAGDANNNVVTISRKFLMHSFIFFLHVQNSNDRAAHLCDSHEKVMLQNILEIFGRLLRGCQLVHQLAEGQCDTTFITS